jgi:two-component system response regulator HydG
VSGRGARVLLAEDNEALRRGMVLALGEAGHRVDEAADGRRAVELLGDASVEPYDVVLTDLRLPGADGLAVLRAARARDPRTAVIVMTAFGTVEVAVDAMRLGAFDFVQKPVGLDQLEIRVARAVEHARLLGEVRHLRAERAARYAPENLVGSSAGVRAAVDLAERAAPSRSTVLVTGETGTGKELVAGLIHALSPRAEKPFVQVNCAALPDTLLESELFGHERGAFTGADRMRIGRFEQADGGTLFLDEVGDMSATTQAKLLRVLQDQEFHRLGGTRVLRTDVRIVAATNQDLETAIAEGRFREDLYFRLAVIGIPLPPLRERGDDVVLLAEHLLRTFSRELGRPRRGFTRAALVRLKEHDWPGNVRELRNAVERATLMAEGEWIEAEDLVLTPLPEAGRGPRDLGLSGFRLADVEREVVMAALRRSGFVQKQAAELLGVSRRKLNYMIRKMGITHSSWRRNKGEEPVVEAPEAPLDSALDVG